MKRYEHFMRPVKSDKQPARFCVVEFSAHQIQIPASALTYREELFTWACETWDMEDNYPVRPKTFNGTTKSQLWQVFERLASKGSVTWIVGYSGSRLLSLAGVWERLEDKTFLLDGHDYREDEKGKVSQDVKSLGYCVLEDPPVIVLGKIPGRPGRLKFVDIRNWGVQSFDDFVTPKSQYMLNDPAEHTDLEMSWEWCKLRADRMSVLVRNMLQCLNVNKWGTLQATAGSQAMTAFKRSYLKHSVLVHAHTEALELERSAMHGGRCEMLRHGVANQPIYQLDFRSLYPSSCIQLQLPIRLSGYSEDVQVSSLSALMDTHEVCADVDIVTDQPIYPCFRNGLTIFPIGAFRTTLAGPELKIAHSAWQVRRVHRCSWYEHMDILTHYMNDMHELRLHCDDNGMKALGRWVKRMMVSVVGKFGQRGKRWIDKPEEIADAPYHSWYVLGSDTAILRRRSVAWHVQEERDDGEGADTVPSVSAWILSAARVKLWNALSVAGVENVWYMDTDSVWCTKEGYDRLDSKGLIAIGELGKLQLEAVHEDCVFYGWKHYVASGRTVCAGLPKGENDHVLGQAVYWYRVWLANAITEGVRPASIRTQRRYTKPSAYKHGTVNEDGTVSPFSLNE